MVADKHTERVNLPPIPAKRYFTIGEVSDLCAVKPHVLRYWEQEFTQLKPVKRRGNRRYYQHHEVLLIRRIRELLYEQGFTINGARNRLDELRHGGGSAPVETPEAPTEIAAAAELVAASRGAIDAPALRLALQSVLDILQTGKS
ncbi:MerR family transcriptional regulator [Ralstonia solanacearum]|uniref:MerR family transcriptional regulator n=1 Tax=Ralstonia solanacearum TaxID=305 RepID=UPI0001D95766|nr:MerR family transcriptional regulator [Ralstonia solanacearum]CBJ51032.1 putative transcriptional regulator, MerR family [Ralstonia solanacearum PSI07]